ncbi:MAG: helix-turn-helix transcriptional regulator [candidate division WOR-3 bacterium]|nr:helix-turn-helix transcriptional regulator [candidate division WOR-3 bacterium]
MNLAELIGAKLRDFRKNAHLTQKDLALRMGLQLNAGQSFVSRLESGQIKNPNLKTVLNYLDALGADWGKFFSELFLERGALEHRQLSKITPLPLNAELQKKLEYESCLYKTKIRPERKNLVKLDRRILKLKVKDKVIRYLQSLSVCDKLLAHYLKFAEEIVDAYFITNSDFNSIIARYKTKEINRNYLIRIISIVGKLYRAQTRKFVKPLSHHKRRQITEKYIKARAEFLLVEKSVHNLLSDYGLVDNVYYTQYMNFARKAYKIYRKYYLTDRTQLNLKNFELLLTYENKGLKKNILEEILLKVAILRS